MAKREYRPAGSPASYLSRAALAASLRGRLDLDQLERGARELLDAAPVEADDHVLGLVGIPAEDHALRSTGRRFQILRRAYGVSRLEQRSVVDSPWRHGECRV